MNGYEELTRHQQILYPALSQEDTNINGVINGLIF